MAEMICGVTRLQVKVAMRKRLKTVRYLDRVKPLTKDAVGLDEKLLLQIRSFIKY